VSFVHAPSLADFITTIVGFKVFGTHTELTADQARRELHACAAAINAPDLSQISQVI
jgi:hypothetical protein